MRLVEVVMLLGAQCVSPVEHGQMMTDATKVQCAVVIEKDTDTGSVTITPPDAAHSPQVMAALAHMAPAAADANVPGSGISPASAPAGSPPVEIKQPAARVVVLPEPIAPAVNDAPTVPTVAARTVAAAGIPATAPAPAAETKVATLVPPPQKPTPAKTPTVMKPAAVSKVAAKAPLQCKAPNVLKWYRKNGARIYHCVEPASDGAPGQLY